MNDMKFFETKLSVEQQELVIKQIEEVRKHSDVDKSMSSGARCRHSSPFQIDCLQKNQHTRNTWNLEIASTTKSRTGSTRLMQIPFGQYKNLPLSLSDGVEASHEFMTNAKRCWMKRCLVLTMPNFK